jgi:hypothetical protein
MSNEDDCASRACVTFELSALAFRLGVIVFSVLLTVAALLSLIITMNGRSQCNRLRRARRVFAPDTVCIAAGIVGFLPLVLCILYVCSLEARLLRKQ